MLRMAQALGLPVVPDVYMSAERSLGALFAAIILEGEYRCNSTGVISSDVGEIPSKDEILNDR
jgi:hypothetical protein